MSVALTDMHDHLVAITGAAHLAKAAREAADRALSDVVADTHYQDFDTHCEQLIRLICGDAGQAIVAAMVDELQAVLADLGDDDPAAQVTV